MTTQTKHTPELLPCPFCGKRAEVFHDSSYQGETTWSDGLGSPSSIYNNAHGVKCVGEGQRPHNDGCGALIYGTPEQWNTRVNTYDAVKAQRDALLEALKPFANPPKTSYGARIINESCYEAARAALAKAGK